MSSPSGVTARFIGANLRGGYVFPLKKSPWRLSLQAGVFYTHMIVKNNEFGYNHLIYPQLTPVVVRKFKSGVAGGYVKYVPILHLDGREYGLGLNWKGQNSVTYSIDFSDFQQTVNSQAAKSRTITLGVGVGW